MADDGSRPDPQQRDAPSDDGEPLLSTAEATPGNGTDQPADSPAEPTSTDDTPPPATGIFDGSSPDMASTSIWLTMLILGCFLAVFALGKAVGLEVSALLDAMLDTNTGQYLLLATVGGLLILMGQRELTSG